MSTERKRKFPWILHPRGKLYTEVQGNSTFGQKILERMGWKKGKGLGRNEDGVVEHVRVHFKNDSKGIGFTGNDGNWLGNQCDFDSLLADLQNEYKNTGSSHNPTSLAVKSKQSKRRVHYHKMVQGKDLSMRSKEDLECILGTNHRRLSTPDTQVEMVEEMTMDNEPDMFTSKDSVESYFAKRRAELLESGQFDAPTTLEPTKRKKKKKKKKELISSEHILEEDGLVNDTDAERVAFVDTNLAYEPCLTESSATEFSTCEKKKKKKKKSKEVATNEDALNELSAEPTSEAAVNGEEIVTKKCKVRTVDADKDDIQHRKQKKRKTDANKVHEELKENCPSGSHPEKVGSKKKRRLFSKRNKFKNKNAETELAMLTNYHAISIYQPRSDLNDSSSLKKRKLELDKCEENIERPVKRVRFCEEVTVHTVAKHDEVRGGALRDFLNWDF